MDSGNLDRPSFNDLLGAMSLSITNILTPNRFIEYDPLLLDTRDMDLHPSVVETLMDESLVRRRANKYLFF